MWLPSLVPPYLKQLDDGRICRLVECDARDGRAFVEARVLDQGGSGLLVVHLDLIVVLRGDNIACDVIACGLDRDGLANGYGRAWYGEVCEGAPVAVGGWVLTDRHGLAPAPCAANSLQRGTVSVNK